MMAIKLGKSEIALAIELRTEKIRWKAIARALSVNTDYLKKKVHLAEKLGFELWRNGNG
jgi:hypothetical protein